MKKIMTFLMTILGFCGIALYIFEKGRSSGYEKGYAEALDDWDCLFDNDDESDDSFFEKSDQIFGGQI